MSAFSGDYADILSLTGNFSEAKHCCEKLFMSPVETMAYREKRLQSGTLVGLMSYKEMGKQPKVTFLRPGGTSPRPSMSCKSWKSVAGWRVMRRSWLG